MKLLLKGGKIYDGTGADAFVSDILIEGDRIASIEENIDVKRADKVIDITGLSI